MLLRYSHSAGLQEGSRLVTETYVESVRAPRVTLTMPVINNALSVLVLVTGKEKAGILRAVVGTDVPQFPANMVHPESGSITWMVDGDASSQLSSGTEP